jgi:uncharacterized protein (DUF1015 family)
MLIEPFHALYANKQRALAEPVFFDAVKEDYQQFLNAGFFLHMVQPALFIYKIATPTRTYTGVLASVDIEAYLSGNIKKHELTIQAEEEKQAQFLQNRQAAVKPVLLTYAENAQIDAWLEHYAQLHPPFLDIHFALEQQNHQFWAIQAADDVTFIQSLFNKYVQHAYIADGHHRMASIARIQQTKDAPAAYRQVFCAFFPSQQLDILPFHRLVKISQVIDLQKLTALCSIEKLAAPALPSAPHEFTLGMGQHWYRLHWRSNALRLPTDTDVALLNDLIMKDLMHIMDVRDDPRIQYIAGAGGLDAVQQKLQTRPDYMAFCLYPISFDTLATLVEAGYTLPPKSTWFEPRMKNGLIVKVY